MSAEKDISLDEKRVFDESADVETVLVATELGVASISVSGEQIGRFGLEVRCVARDVAAVPGEAAVATEDGVLRTHGAEFAETGFAPAVAVGYHDEVLVAADETGRVARYEGAADEWSTVGTLDADVRAIDGDLLATSEGVYRVVDGDLSHAGLADVRDVAAAGTPHAASDGGLYALGNGWMCDVEGDATLVEVDRHTASASGVDRAHAVVDGGFLAHDDGAWLSIDLPVDETVAGVAYGTERPFVVTEDGTVLLEGDAGEWHYRSLGLAGVAGVAVP
ncbi:HVO_0234 family beta-propeller protein [Halospeciosus flavus]|uniref:HVO-0234-like beta-propeller domain-containing protein n=1 Tax=Halospeciosus flavus TaxID=3032283 RepID=A0ABD5Z6W5_9EURY|nr:hypothetical protein [Halospeciosus flavus]